jgi:hypothetical protein
LQKPGDSKPKVLRLSYAAVAASLIGNSDFKKSFEDQFFKAIYFF